MRRWVRAACGIPAEVTVRFVDENEGQTLNRDYRGKDYATNVLTFDYAQGDVLTDQLLGEALKRLAGVLAAKKTSDLIPLCHPLLVGSVLVNFLIEDEHVEVEAHVDTVDRTGVEFAATIFRVKESFEYFVQSAGVHPLTGRGQRSGTGGVVPMVSRHVVGQFRIGLETRLVEPRFGALVGLRYR